MPPIPSQAPTFSDPDVTLAISSLEQRRTFLASTVIPSLATLPASTPLLEQQRRAEGLREDLEDLGKRIETLEQLVEDLDTEKERRVGRDVVLQWAADYAALKKDARAALLSSKKAIDQHAKSRRDELLGSAVYKQPYDREENEKTDDALMRTTASLTDALRRTEARLKAELDRSMLSTQLLTSQTATLRQTSNAHGQLTSLLDTSKGLITALERTDWLDRMLILGALAVFLLTCAWIIKVRIFDRAFSIAFWWVKWMPSWGDDKLLDELEKGARVLSNTVQDASTVIKETASSALAAITENATSSLQADGMPSPSSTLSAIFSDVSEAANTTPIISAASSTVTKVASILRDEL
ncbi:hypothetical protein PIIN_04369 [Serendipita indica DSM 11827]|uniref:Sec20 C-terminal domain-containing protein n=1 Tax=Serendipita indica (strain DSM 11827) TaxID=1109443 RepID=G4TGI0_SERID|nr:hypothetical protein PIIN_04369 [Serendipita indica DSM 11827]